MKVDVLLGLQWGDEGKGKVIDVLTPVYDIIARFQGGPNAGHTLEFNGSKHILHTIPSGIFHGDTVNIIGNGVIIDPLIFSREIQRVRDYGNEPSDNLKISAKAHLILPTHRLLDAATEKKRGEAKIGSTLKGIGPAYTDKTARYGLRVSDLNQGSFYHLYKERKIRHLEQIKCLGYSPEDFSIEGMHHTEYEELWFKSLEVIKQIEIIDCEYYINNALNKNKKVLAEGAQGSLLDIDHGSYPFVTSSSTTSAGVCSGLGVAPGRIGDVFGIFKAYATRVGSGPFPTELSDSIGEQMRKAGNEFGSTTGRPRRCGWLDMPALKYANMINGTTALIMTKADVLSGFDKILSATEYIKDGKTSTSFSLACSDPDYKPSYHEHEGWKSDISMLKRIDEIPEQLEKYIKYVEEETGIPVCMIGVGPDRTQTLKRE